MPDGFQINSAVPDRGQRENPTGVSGMGALPALGVPTNVPIVMPSKGNMQSNIQPNNGAMELAQTLGNINFGSLANAFTTRSQLQTKLKGEQESANAQAEVSALLAKTGQDYGTLVRNNRIPLYKTPNAQLGQSIAGSKAVLGQLHNAVLQRRAENPDAGVFNTDSEFMAPFIEQLQGVRNEAAVKYFFDPIEALAQDDMKGLMTSKNEAFKFKLEGDTTSFFSNAVKAGAAPGAAANDAFSTLKIAGHLTDSTSSSLIKTAATEIAASVIDPISGQLNVQKATQKLMELGSTKLDAFGGNLLRDRFPDEFSKARSVVFQAATEAAAADKTQREASAMSAQGKFIEWLGVDGNYGKNNTQQLIQQANKLGMESDKAIQVIHSYQGLDGNVSRADDEKDAWELQQSSAISTMTPGQLDQKWSDNDRMVKEKMRTNAQGVIVQKLITAARGKHNDAPIPTGDQQQFKTTINKQLRVLFGNDDYMYKVMDAATMKLGFKPGQVDKVQAIVAEHLAKAGIPWVQSDSARMSNYEALKANIQQNQTGPTTYMEQSARDFINLNRTPLRDAVVKALTSNDPESALGAINFHHLEAAPVQRPAQPKPQVPKVVTSQPVQHVDVVKETANANRELQDPNSAVYGWYANHIRSKHPDYTDREILLRIRNLTPDARLKLKQSFLQMEKH